ncbi:MAG: hypothetical protein KC800_20030, partial [Candidatus Eremiobacteraeota bacterium]|nr:hypothetical protein [Candidatus Eremiobacteraeota bacterium]
MESEEEKKPRYSLAERFWGGIWALVVLTIILTFWQEPYVLTLMSPFRFQMFVVLSFLSLPPLFVFSGKQRILFVAVPLMVGLTFFSYLPVGTAQTGPTSFAVIVTNVFSGNRDLTRLKEWIADHPADVVGVLEVSSWHEEQLAQMGYEHVLKEPRVGNFGIALLSKEAPIHSEIIGLETPFPVILAEFENYRVLLVHPPPP